MSDLQGNGSNGTGVARSFTRATYALTHAENTKPTTVRFGRYLRNPKVRTSRSQPPLSALPKAFLHLQTAFAVNSGEAKLPLASEQTSSTIAPLFFLRVVFHSKVIGACLVITDYIKIDQLHTRKTKKLEQDEKKMRGCDL